MDVVRKAYEAWLIKNEKYPLNSLTREDYQAIEEHEKRSEAAKKAAVTRKLEAEEEEAEE